MSETLYNIKEIAEICDKTPRAIRYYADSEGLGRKLGKEWKFNEREKDAIIRHYTNVSDNNDETENVNNDETENVNDDKEKDVLADKVAYLTDFIDELRKQLEVKEKEIDFKNEQLKNADEEKIKLHDELAEKDKQIANFQEQIDKLIQTNNNLSLPTATRALDEAKDIIESEHIQENTEKIPFGKRLKGLFTGRY